MKISANLQEIESLIRKCQKIQDESTYAPCEKCVLEDFCEGCEQLHKKITFEAKETTDE